MNEVSIFIPPIRDRIEDIYSLIDHFLDILNKDNNKEIKLSDEARRYLLAYPWPGNVREIKNLIQRLVILAGSDLVQSNELPCEYKAYKRHKRMTKIEYK